QVKVTALTRLVVSLYSFNALALMLHMQLHILGRLSFEESQHFLLQPPPTSDLNASSSTANPSPTSLPGATTPPGFATTAAAAAGLGDRGATAAAAGSGSGEVGVGVGAGGGVGGGGAGVALSMEARHALLSSTYEYVLGNGLRELVRDVERAVSRCTCRYML
ncbi:unnamed protein product, partial [Laminaria digitata]